MNAGKDGGIGRHVLVAMILAVVLYAAGYSLDQHLRVRRGPWEVTFTNDASGAPAIVIDQPKLNVAGVRIVFAGETVINPATTVRFNVPQKPIPVGKVKFEDLTYLPGTVTLDLFGHEIELIPRTLFVNRREHPWTSATTVVLDATNKLTAPSAR